MQAVSMDNANRNQRAFIGAVIVHAALIAAWWWAAIYADIDVPGGRAWLPLALAWVLWPICAIVKYRGARGVWAALIVGAVLIAPTASTIYAFSVWSVSGFAP